MFCPPPKRCGLKLRKHIATAVARLLLLALFGVLLSATVSGAGEASSLWGSSTWFDWADYRAAIGIRAWLPRLASGSIDTGEVSYDLKTDFGMISDPEPFREFWAEMYIDRLGIRLRVEEDNTFKGRVGLGTDADTIRSSELETNTAVLGLDVDLIRYPFLRLGVDYDYYFGELKFHDRRSPDPSQWTMLAVGGRQPMTVGVHGLAIPTRIRGVPITVQARLRIPVPFVLKGEDARITEWEISGGLRPAIWETSLYAHSTFSVGLSGGFKAVNLETEVISPDGREAKLKARWQGAFIELGLAF